MASAEEFATIRISFADSEEINTTSIMEIPTSTTSMNAKAYPVGENQQALPPIEFTNAWVNELGKIIISAKGDSADTVESEESNGTIPIILKQKSTGIVTRRKLRLGDAGTADFSGFNSTNDVALITANFTKLGAYTVPSGYMATLDGGKPLHIYLGDDTA